MYVLVGNSGGRSMSLGLAGWPFEGLGQTSVSEWLPPRVRLCCLLEPGSLVDPSALGTHGSSGEVIGLIYTGKAGFLDLGHTRETCDLAKHVFDEINAATTFPISVETIHGMAKVRKKPPSAIKVARAISYVDALGHEIWTYDMFGLPGGHNSSFSPEDLCSNFLGTLLAERAIAAGGGFNAAVTKELGTMISALDGQTVAESRTAFNLINGCWVNFGSRLDLGNNDYLRRRNFRRIQGIRLRGRDRSHQERCEAPGPVWGLLC
jgi:hypothetical protein